MPIPTIPTGAPLAAPNAKPELMNPFAQPPAAPEALRSTLSAPATSPKPELQSVSPALAPALAPAVTPVPSDLIQHMEELETWAQSNRKEARQDTFAFWSLKIPAIVSAASAGVLGHYQLTTASLVLGAIASFCGLIDGFLPRGQLRNAHHRAWLDIRALTASMAAQWRTRRQDEDRNDVARKVIEDAEKERKRITKFVADAESALKYK